MGDVKTMVEWLANHGMAWPIALAVGTMTYLLLNNLLRVTIVVHRRIDGERRAVVRLRIGQESSEKIPSRPELPAVGVGDPKPHKGD